jgi:maltose O-acetyltransferase
MDPGPSSPPATEGSRTLRIGVTLAKLARVVLEEANVQPRKLACRALSHGLPHLSFNRTRTAFLRAAGVRIGAGSLIMGGVDVTGPGDLKDLLSIGERTFITGPLHIDLGASVRIGNDVQLGHRVSLLTIDHEIGASEHRCGPLITAPIVIEQGAWLASHVTVLAGVTVHRGAIVAAGAVVTHDVAADTLVAGVPARFVRALDEEPLQSARRGSARPIVPGARG